jgi:hypothetical protein
MPRKGTQLHPETGRLTRLTRRFGAEHPAFPYLTYKDPGCVTSLARLRLGLANPAPTLPLREKPAAASSDVAVRADFAMRGFAICCLMARRVAASASLSFLEFLLDMPDDDTFAE